jgi:hypothetical protein
MRLTLSKFASVMHPVPGDAREPSPASAQTGRNLAAARGAKPGQIALALLLRKGLPQAWAYDLVYRHALALDASGERLAFGSTTGSAWISEDGGDNWLTLAEHLPPALAVAFV